jgi:cystathionine beta-lyase/cystathionine gamma-synthase
MGVRLAQQMDSGMEVAHWLSKRPEVKQVLHPALPGAPGHAIWKRDFTGACSLFGIELQPQYSVESAHAFVDALELFGIGGQRVGAATVALGLAQGAFEAATTSLAASCFCASLSYCITAEIAPILVSTAMRPVTPQTRAISSMMTTASRKLPPAPPYSRGIV